MTASGEQSTDLMLHLGGEQMLPNLIMARLYPARRHIVFVSRRTGAAGQRFANACMRGKNGAPVECVVLDHPHDVADSVGVMRTALQRAKAGRVVCNITGGTKPMSFAALSVAASHDATPCLYLDMEKRAVHHLENGQWHADNVSDRPGPLTVDDFIALSSYSPESHGLWEDKPARAARGRETARLWKKREYLQREQGKIQGIVTQKNGIGAIGREGGTLFASQGKGGVRNLVIGGEKVAGVDDWKDFWSYLGGEWLEEYTYLQLLPLLESGGIVDLRIDLNLRQEDCLDRLEDGSAKPTLNQVDVAFTDGWRLWLIECKAGRCSQENVQKLENLVMHLGGAHGCGCLLLIGAEGQKNGIAAAVRRVMADQSRVFCIWARDIPYHDAPKPLPKDLVAKRVGGNFSRVFRERVIGMHAGDCCLVS